ncbi:winged helix-turn-helix transcriptional regulator [Lactococcus laudensis]|uniref:winged helix-turn-helix transcriptional regulator n=1 Tax=Pseudolactococcus laudensis TaxID=1494461 RepID=UPI002FC6E250
MEVCIIENKKSLPACPVELTLSLIGNKWKFLIIRDLLVETKRFSVLKRSIGSISQKVLTDNLRQLETSGIVTRKVYAEVPPRVEYSLTPLGQSLDTVLNSLMTWGEHYKNKYEP